MNQVLNYLLLLFGEPEYDWLHFKVTEANPLTFHHIKRKWEGGEDIITNGSLLTKLGHQYLHQIEQIDTELYNSLNNFFQIINERGFHPTLDELKAIDEKLKVYEKKNQNELKRRIKLKDINYKLLQQLNGGISLNEPTNLRMNMQLGIPVYKNKSKRHLQKQKKRKSLNSK